MGTETVFIYHEFQRFKSQKKIEEMSKIIIFLSIKVIFFGALQEKNDGFVNG